MFVSESSRLWLYVNVNSPPFKLTTKVEPLIKSFGVPNIPSTIDFKTATVIVESVEYVIAPYSLLVASYNCTPTPFVSVYVTLYFAEPTVTSSSPSTNAAWIKVTYWCNSVLSLDSFAFFVNWEYPTTDTVAKIN